MRPYSHKKNECGGGGGVTDWEEKREGKTKQDEVAGSS